MGVRAGAAGHRGFSPGDLSWQQARQQDATCSDREACGAGHHHLHGLLAGIQRSDGAGLPALHGEPLKRRITRGGIKKGYLMEHFGEHIFMKDHSDDIFGAMVKEIVKQYA